MIYVLETPFTRSYSHIRLYNTTFPAKAQIVFSAGLPRMQASRFKIECLLSPPPAGNGCIYGSYIKALF